MSYKDYEPFDLAAGNFVIGRLEGLEIDNITNAFAGFVDEVLAKINVGKEATVYLCRASAQAVAARETDSPYLAAKLYRARKFRNFENDGRYRNLDKLRDRRLARQMRGKSRRGRQAFHHHWVEGEWRALCRLWALGVHVPKPCMHCPDGILMGYVGDASGPAPRLVNCRLDAAEAVVLRDAIVADIEAMAAADLVHGDLSAYNILYDGSRHTIIDFPQTADVRQLPNARGLFQRDLVNVEKYFSKYQLTIPVRELMRKYF